MIRFIKLIFALIIITVTMPVKGQGIDFKHISYEEALLLAKEQDKLLFIDFYTQWCGPCKKLAKGPFLENEVGDFYNTNFINLKLDAEQEGLEAARAHKVVSYPTLLFINGDGNLIFKGYGRTNEELIASAQDALDAFEGDYSLEKLNEEFAKRQNDEKFLKLYLSKARDFGVNPTNGIEAWLKVQTEIKESSAEMMNFILKNDQYLRVGGKAEAIVQANVDSWSEMCDEREARRVNFLQKKMLLNTKRQAYRLNDAMLLKAYINAVSLLPEDSKLKSDITVDQLKYYMMVKDYQAYRTQAEHVVDSLMKHTDVKAIHQSDKETYNRMKAAYEGKDDPHSQIMLEVYKNGISATKEIKPIEEIAQDYLKLADNKSHFKTLNKWIQYCYKLVPEYYLVDNLKANMLYKSGKVEQGIELKKSALSKYPVTEKKRIHQQNELQKMIEGDALFNAMEAKTE